MVIWFICLPLFRKSIVLGINFESWYWVNDNLCICMYKFMFFLNHHEKVDDFEKTSIKKI